MEDFVHLHVHTFYSVLDGQSKITHLVDKAINNGMKGMAITDHGVMFGIKEFSDYCANINKKRKKNGEEPFKPIFGCEMYVARRRKQDKVKDMHDNSGYHLIVLAKNYQGYKNLIKLVSRSWIDGFYYRPRTDRADLEKYHEGLIVCSACLAGEIPRNILKGDINAAREAVEWYQKIFGDDFYLELQRHEVKDPTLMANREAFPLQQKVNCVLLQFSKEYGIKYVCTNDCHFEDKETAEAHDHLLCLSTQEELNSPTRMRYSKQEWFKTREEMNDVFSDLPDALSNTLEILDKVEMYSIDNGPIMPFFPIPESFGTEEIWRKRFSEQQLYDEFTTDENGENQLSPEDGQAVIDRLGGYEKIYRIKFEADYLSKLAHDGAKKLYGDPIPEDVQKAITFELHVMKTMGFPGYFLIVQDFINAARHELNVMVGPGRGSAAGSVVAYCLGITRIDPLKYDLLFERFLNPDRVNLPDIDTDFDDDGRGKVLQWVINKYGAENCAHIITYSTMATKNSIKDVARVEGLPLEISNRLCKAIPDRLPDGMKMNLTNAIACTPLLQEAEVSEDARERNTIKYAKMLEGTVRGTGIHACGFIICRDPISDWVPVSTASDPDFPEKKVPVTQYDGHVIETTGLIKMDFLGLKTLTLIKHTEDLIKKRGGEYANFSIEQIDEQDAATFKMLGEGKSAAVFQFESQGMQNILKRAKPDKIEDLIALNALYRPGPMAYIDQFIESKFDASKIQYPDPCLEDILSETYGVIVYQEQVMQVAQRIGGYSLGQADLLRRAMGKKKKEVMEKEKTRFIEGAVKNNFKEKDADRIFEILIPFAGYGFNKSHAAAYSVLAYQTAYLKANFPAEFMAANLTNEITSTDKLPEYISEANKMGLALHAPDINTSEEYFSVYEGDIVFGLLGIKGVGEQAARDIVAERTAHGPYKSFIDFLDRLDLHTVNKKNLEVLIKTGCFDKLGQNRSELLDNLEAAMAFSAQKKAGSAVGQTSLFEDTGIKEFSDFTFKQVNDLPQKEKLRIEKELMGFYISGHPLDEYKKAIDRSATLELINFRRAQKEKLYTIVGMITGIRPYQTKNGKWMGFGTFEDRTGTIDLTFFSKVWEENRANALPETVCGLIGKVDCSRDTPSFLVESMVSIDELKERSIKEVHLELDPLIETDLQFQPLKDFLFGAQGTCDIFIHITDNDTVYQVKGSSQLKVSSSDEFIEQLGKQAGVLQVWKE